MYASAMQAYKTQQARGVGKVQQVALIYDRLIASLREAIQAIEDKEIEKRHNANKRAQDIILALYGGLDMENGGDISQNLERLYLFSLRRLPQVDVRNDPKPAQEVIKILGPLRDSWHELARREAAGTLQDAELDDDGNPIPPARATGPDDVSAESAAAAAPAGQDLPAGGLNLAT